MRNHTLALIAAFALASACDPKAKPSGEKPTAADAALPTPAMEPEDAMRKRPEIKIQPAGPGDLGDQKVLADGMTVWPPTGPGCEPFVACCRAAALIDRAMGLACQLSVARTPVDCGKALAMVRRLMGERMMVLPATCAMP